MKRKATVPALATGSCPRPQSSVHSHATLLENGWILVVYSGSRSTLIKEKCNPPSPPDLRVRPRREFSYIVK